MRLTGLSVLPPSINVAVPSVRAFCRRLAMAAAVACVVLGVSASAQDLPDVAQGLQPYVSYHGGGLDSVSTLNGGLTIRIPLVSYPQKGALSLSYSVVFNSFGYQTLTACDAAEDPTGSIDEIPLRIDCHDTIQFAPLAFGSPTGPSLVMDQELIAAGSSAPMQVQSVQPPIQGRFYIITPDNAQHPLGALGNAYLSVDDAGYRFVPSSAPAVGVNLPLHPSGSPPGFFMVRAAGTITDSRGIVHTPGGMTDADGNTIAYTNTGVIDSVRRIIPSNVAITATIAQCPTLQNALNQPVTNVTQWTVPGSGGNSTYLFCYAQVRISTALTNNPQSNELSLTMGMLQSIVLPNGTYWGFIYDSAPPANSGSHVAAYGQLTTLIYPTGGSTSYGYSFSPGFCDAARADGTVAYAIALDQPVVSSRTMFDAQGHMLGRWSYVYPEGRPTGSVLSATGDLTVNHFVSSPGDFCQFFDAGHDVYQGSSALQSALLQSTAKTISFEGAPGSPVLILPRETMSTNVLGDGSTSTVQTSYAPGLQFSSINCDYHGLNCTIVPNPGTISIGGPTAKTYTDYSGAVIKTDSTTYQWQTNPSYFAANLLDIPSTTRTLDASNTVQSQTTYTYDESTYSPGGVRGHVTTVVPWLNSGAAPTTHTGWNSSGEKSYIVDAAGNHNANGHTADYVYGDCAGSVVTSTTNALN